MSRREIYITKDELDRVWSHIETLNHEMGEVCERIAKVETNTQWIKWLSVSILGSIIALAFKLVGVLF